MMSRYFNSKNIAILISLFILISHYYIRTYQYNNWSNILGWDVLSYYIYLPFTFIHGDLGMTNQDIIKYIFDTYSPSSTFYQAYQLPNGNWQPMYTIGFALIYLPFFLIGHIWALLSNYPADGFSFPYQFAIGNGVMIYIIFGIFIARKILLKLFSEKIAIAVMLIIFLGTNYFHESIAEETMPHAILFTAVAACIYLTMKWHDKPSYITISILGFICGLAILSRGSVVMMILIPILWNVYNKESFLLKINILKKHYKHLLLFIIFFLITPILQMIIWKINTGSFIFFTYQNTEGFDWLKPHFLKVLFSYKKSLLIYTPIFIFFIISFFNTFKHNKKVFWPLFLYFIINFYMLSSWAAWWQGGSFGMRYFVESFAVSIIPMGYFIKWILDSKIFIKLFFAIIFSFFILLNIFQTWQFNNWILDGYAMTKEYYWKVFFKTNVSEEDKKLREIIRDFKSEETFSNPGDYNKKTLGIITFDSINSIILDNSFRDTSYYKSYPYSCKMTKDRPFSQSFKLPYNQITKKEHAWIRVSFDYFPIYDINESPSSLIIHFNHNDRFTLKYKGYDLEKFPYKLNEWNHLTCDYLTPYPLSEDNELIVYFWLRGEKEIYIDNIHIEAFERKW